MRIITGSLKGREIPIPKDAGVRPTSDRTKEGIFNVIAARRFFSGLSVLDLFAGSGNLGLEAISRGAASAMFVDISPHIIKHIQQLAEKFDVLSKSRFRCSDVMEYLSSEQASFDLIFCDPPYDYEFMTEIPEAVLSGGLLDPEGWLILEHDKRHSFAGHPQCFFSKAYGRTIVSIFQRQKVD